MSHGLGALRLSGWCLEWHPTATERAIASEVGGEGGIRTHVPVTRQDAFEAPPLRPLRYLSVWVELSANRTLYRLPGPFYPTR